MDPLFRRRQQKLAELAYAAFNQHSQMQATESMFLELLGQQQALSALHGLSPSPPVKDLIQRLQAAEQENARLRKVNAAFGNQVVQLAEENQKLKQELYSQPRELGRISVDAETWQTQRKIIKNCWLCRLRYAAWCTEDSK
ncbi:hypothetical protein GC174_14775 [bacterium]|nr:hypothetical protein [bacterium]